MGLNSFLNLIQDLLIDSLGDVQEICAFWGYLRITKKYEYKYVYMGTVHLKKKIKEICTTWGVVPTSKRFNKNI